MSFSFGFTQENFSDDELIETELTGTSSTIKDESNPFALDQVLSKDPNTRSPKVESLDDFLNSLINIRVTFEEYQTPGGNIVFRRELFDVKHQLMSEDNAEEENDGQDEFSILIGDDSTDLKKNIYEGGLKSWECSVDTVDQLSTFDDNALINKNVIELGCGTSLPSTYIFGKLLRSNYLSSLTKTFVLSDYNSSVLRLVTLPNLIITWAATLSAEDLISLQRSDDENIPIVQLELQFTKQLIHRFKETLQSKQISLVLISGAWSREFINIVNDLNVPFPNIITSETIYSPDTLPVISELLIELVQSNKTRFSTDSLAIVAAKDIYFGVGGSIVEFENYLIKRQSQGVQINYKIEKINAGLKRSIVYIN